MEVVALPPMRMVSDQPFSGAFLFRSKIEGPVDLTETVHGVAWAGQATFTRESPAREPEALLTVPLALKASGRILLDLTEEQVALLTGPHVICQINLDAPHPDFNEVWRAVVTVQ